MTGLYVSTSQLPVSPDGAGAWRIATDGGRGEDLYAVWNSVFEDMQLRRDEPDTGQPAHPQFSQQPSATQAAFQGPAQEVAFAGLAAGTDRDHVERITPVRDELQPAVPSAAVAADDLPQSTAGTETASASTNARWAIAAAAADGPGVRASASAVKERSEVPQDQIARASTHGECLLPDESAQVFVHAAGVAIVVRNSALSDGDAVNSAFETARELTGRRSALVHLTLNGRALYQQAEEADTRGSTAGSAFVFAC
jgi:hypothetical protein